MNQQETALAGNIDRVTEDGIAEGWCWDKNRPGQRLNLTILLDGEAAGTTTAMLFRGDLADAGIGDGYHGFKFPLPYSAMGKRRKLNISVCETETGALVGSPYLLFLPEIVTIDDRVTELENMVKLLQSRLAEVLEQPARQSMAASSALFQSVGAFFLQLAAGAEAGEVQPGPIGAMLGTLAASYPTLTLPRPETPAATICLEADAPFAELHGSILSLLSNGICETADIVLLDPGTHEDAALLPALVRNLRYVRTKAELLAERNEIAAASRTKLIVFLSAHARLGRGWLDEIRQIFADGKVVAAGGKLLRGDGLLEHAGLALQGTGLFADFGAGRVDGEPDSNYLRRVDALGAYAVAFRRSAFLDAGGFDVAFPDKAAATLDLCLRLTENGAAIMYQPYARAEWRDVTSERTRWVVEEPGHGLLAQRWGGRLAAMAAALKTQPGRALVLAGGQTGTEDLASAEALLSRGYEVIYGHTFSGSDDPGYETMTRTGIRALAPPFYASLEAYLRKEGGTLRLIHAPGQTRAEMETLKALVPNAEIVADQQM